jgi:hypothetical protein
MTLLGAVREQAGAGLASELCGHRLGGHDDELVHPPDPLQAGEHVGQHRLHQLLALWWVEDRRQAQLRPREALDRQHDRGPHRAPASVAACSSVERATRPRASAVAISTSVTNVSTAPLGSSATRPSINSA